MQRISRFLIFKITLHSQYTLWLMIEHFKGTLYEKDYNWKRFTQYSLGR